MDLNYTRDTTSGQEGLDLLSNIRGIDNTLPVVVMTAWGSVKIAVEAMRLGARDFIQKPWENERLLSIIRTQTELARALRKGQRLEAENLFLRDQKRPRIIAESAAMQPVLQLIDRIGPSEANVLITGEHGTGKGLVAQSLYAISPRSPKPLVTVNAGGLSEGIFESELFGHVKGAFTDAKSEAWALAAAVVLAGQRLGVLQAVGAALVLAAIVGHELASLRFEVHGHPTPP
jgi:DNA-binding NtrC family response regulator